jgi:prephenate dehydratase
VFFVDIDGHASDERLGRALKALGPVCEQVKVLGSYPRADALERS